MEHEQKPLTTDAEKPAINQQPSAIACDGHSDAQIECPPCAMRGSELPVSGLQPAPQRPKKPPTTAAGVRENRASQLRRNRQKKQARRQIMPTRLQAENEDSSSDLSMTSAEEEEEENDKATWVKPQRQNQLSGVVEAPEPKSSSQPRRSSMATLSLVKSPADSQDRSAIDFLARPIDMNRSRTNSTTSASSVSPKSDHDRVRDKLTGSASALNLTKLRTQLQETNRQRALLKDRITGLTKVISTAAGQRTSSSSLDDNAGGSRPPPVAINVGVQAGPDRFNKGTQLVDERIPALLERVQQAAMECAKLRLDREARMRELEAAKFDQRMASADAQERRADLAQAGRELELREERIRQLAASQARAEKEAENLRSQLGELRRQVDSAENSCQSELARNQRYRAQLTSLEAQLDTRMSELTAVTNALIEKRRSEDELLARVQQLQRALNSSEESVKRLTDQLTKEQTSLRETLKLERSRFQQESQESARPQPQQSQQQLEHQLSSDVSSLTALSPEVDATPVAADGAAMLAQRMAELDARIGQLVADTKNRGWLHQSQQQQQDDQDDQQQHSFVVTSTPRSPPAGVSGGELSEASLESLLQRTAHLETSNRLLVADVQSLRVLCTDLQQSRRDLKRRIPDSQVSHTADHEPQLSPPNHAQLELSNYLFETETLREMIHRQVRDLKSSGAAGTPPRQAPLSDELRVQQETVNRCWRDVQRSYLPASPNPSSPGAYRDFYLKSRTGREGPGEAPVAYAANVVNYMRPMNVNKEQATKTNTAANLK